MFTKLYEKTKDFFKENYKTVIFLILFIIIINVNLPFYINAPGGLMNVSDRVIIEDSYEASGSLNMAYVTEMKANIPALILSLFNKDWDVLREEDIKYENESLEDVYYRERLMLDESMNNAIIVGFEKAGKKVEITDSKLFVTYVDKQAKTDIKIGDEILEIDNISVTSTNEINDILSKKKENEEITIKVISNKKEVIKKAKLRKENKKAVIGILITEKKEIETIPKVDIKFKKSESGPSGGLMTSLAIYNYLTKEDITHGKIIVGTGTIDVNGNVGSIGGVKYKLKGAVKNGAEIFFVPNGENYDEAIKLKKENNYDIEIIGVSTIDDALDYLSKTKK